MIDTVFDN